LILSIVTGTRNRPQDFARLMVSIEAHTSVDHEVIVADASEDPLYTDDLAENVVVLRERPPLGYSRGYNAAFRRARGTWVIWLNDDVEVLPGYADAAIHFMETHSAIGLGALYYREGFRDFAVHSYFGMLYANFGILEWNFGDAIGWFDEDLPMYGTDNALAFKVLLAGKGIAAIPQARIIHYATQDIHRRENSEPGKRLQDAETLITKYGPLMTEMREVNARMSIPCSAAVDQTPEWMLAQF
jgi:GT2 family glycosyltransferase